MTQYTFDFSVLTIADLIDLMDAAKEFNHAKIVGVMAKTKPDVYTLQLSELFDFNAQFFRGLQNYLQKVQSQADDGLTPDGIRLLRNLFGDEETKA